MAFPIPEQDFGKYVEETQRWIRAGSASLGIELHDQIVRDRSPFELVSDTCQQSKRHGVLLVHGLFDSAFIMRDLGRALAKDCMLVRSILLPGHGTVPGDLLHTKYQEWELWVKAGVRSFPEQTEAITLIGYSIGGTLALDYLQCIYDDPRILNAVLIAPGIIARDKALPLSNMHLLYSWLIPGAAWGSLQEELDDYKYESRPKNAYYQFYLLSEKVRKSAVYGFRAPVLMIAADEDGTVDTRAAANLVCTGKGSLFNRLLIYHNNPAVEPIYKELCGERVTFRPSKYESLRILNHSHISIPVEPRNAHYGAEGLYKNCLHYRTRDGLQNRYQSCMGNDYFYGESSDFLASAYSIRRLTFNPDFNWTVDEIRNFIKNQ